ncbi:MULTISPECIES: IS630 family transposase [unclassified Wolbachia]|uniref:IS630 family transposase n=1 Tax=unclassified Wolbachia TaxID=2640676 RepID=UPI00223231AB|nr:IS630 family transposase [Wolbachia endosymbiont (group A) of Apoderus coryli]
MAGKSKAIGEELYNQCKLELKKYGIRGEIGRRLQAIISAKEYGISKVAKIYRITRTTLMKWIARFKEKGVIGFAIQPGRGPKPKLNEEKKEKIREVIEEDGANLTAKKLQGIVEGMLAIKISESTARRLMKKLGFTYITPRPAHYKQEEFKKNLNEIVEKNQQKEVFFFDESRFGTHSKVGHGWFKKGSRTQVKVKIGRENFYLYSAINPRNGDDVSLLAPHVNTDCMNIFLEQMSKDLGTREAFLIMDCASWHRSKGLKTPENITIIYLPPYSPELNPVERFWQHLKDNLIKNKMYDSIKLLENAVSEFIRDITESSIKTICSVNYLSSYL